jgi:hypothetical protein
MQRYIFSLSGKITVCKQYYSLDALIKILHLKILTKRDIKKMPEKNSGHHIIN